MLFLIILRVSVFPDFLKIKSAFNINIVTIIKKLLDMCAVLMVTSVTLFCFFYQMGCFIIKTFITKILTELQNLFKVFT